jgi:hypothetical protein
MIAWSINAVLIFLTVLFVTFGVLRPKGFGPETRRLWITRAWIALIVTATLETFMALWGAN